MHLSYSPWVWDKPVADSVAAAAAAAAAFAAAVAVAGGPPTKHGL